MKTVILAAIVDKKRPMPNPEFVAFVSRESFARYLEASLSSDVVIVNVQVVPFFTPVTPPSTDETETEA